MVMYGDEALKLQDIRERMLTAFMATDSEEIEAELLGARYFMDRALVRANGEDPSAVEAERVSEWVRAALDQLPGVSVYSGILLAKVADEYYPTSWFAWDEIAKLRDAYVEMGIEVPVSETSFDVDYPRK